jgi:hypothetical protein
MFRVVATIVAAAIGGPNSSAQPFTPTSQEMLRQSEFNPPLPQIVLPRRAKEVRIKPLCRAPDEEARQSGRCGKRKKR